MNPAVEYRRLQSEIRAIIDRFPEVLNTHIDRQERHPEFWSFVGDLKKARLELLEVAAFLGDEQSREILHVEAQTPRKD
jgi:hypothetical protein